MASDDKRKHTLYFREGDFDYLKTICDAKGLSTSKVIRDLVSKYVDRLRTIEGPHEELPEIYE